MLSSVACSAVDKEPFIMVVFDGGGVRGAIQCAIMEKFIEILGKPDKWVDMFVGTSVGGLQALAYSKGVDHKKIEAIFQERAEEIFPRTYWQSLRNILSYVWGPQYSNSGLRNVVNSLVGDITMAELKTAVYITSTDVEQGKRQPFIHVPSHSSDPEKLPKSEQPYLVKEVALATAAAPTLFDAIPLQDLKDAAIHHTLVDGGLDTNYPVMEAYRKCSKMGLFEGKKVVILHLGTGSPPKDVLTAEKIHRMGALDWINPAQTIFFDEEASQVESDIHFLQREDRLTYFKMDVTLTASQARMDNSTPKNMRELQEKGFRQFDTEYESGRLQEFISYARRKF